MRITATETKTEEIKTVKDVFCNKCGESFMGSNEYDCAGTKLNAFFGYGSNKDGLDESFDICDSCYDEFTDTFKYPPEKI